MENQLTPFLDKERDSLCMLVHEMNDRYPSDTRSFIDDANEDTLQNWLKAHDERVLTHIRQIVGGKKCRCRCEANNRIDRILADLTLPTNDKEAPTERD